MNWITDHLIIIGCLIVALAALIWYLVTSRKVPSDIKTWHPMLLLMEYSDPETRAEVLRRHPEIMESWRAGDSATDFIHKYPMLATTAFGYLATTAEPLSTEPAPLIPDDTIAATIESETIQ